MFKNPKNIMVSILFLIAVAAILYFAATKQVDKMLLTFGFTFLGVGILWLCTNKPTWETAPFSIILLAGAGLILVSLDKMGASFLSALPDNWISIFFLAAAIMIGAILIISSIMDVKIKRKRCTCMVQAQCIDLGKAYNHLHVSENHEDATYCPKWKYTYNGKEYTYRSTYGTNMTPPKLYEFYPLMIDPTNPEFAYSPGYALSGNAIIVGTVAIIVGVVGLYFVLFK